MDNKSIDEIIEYLNGIKTDLQSRADSASTVVAAADAIDESNASADAGTTVNAEAPAVTHADNADVATTVAGTTVKNPAVFAELEGLPPELLEGLDNSLLDQYAGFTGETVDSLKRKLNAYRSLYNESYDDTRKVLESKFNDAKSPSNRLKIMLDDGSVVADAMDTIKKDGGTYAAIAKRDAALADAYGIIEQLKSQLEGTNMDVNNMEVSPIDNDEKKIEKSLQSWINYGKERKS